MRPCSKSALLCLASCVHFLKIVLLLFSPRNLNYLFFSLILQPTYHLFVFLLFSFVALRFFKPCLKARERDKAKQTMIRELKQTSRESYTEEWWPRLSGGRGGKRAASRLQAERRHRGGHTATLPAGGGWVIISPGVVRAWCNVYLHNFTY